MSIWVKKRQNSFFFKYVILFYNQQMHKLELLKIFAVLNGKQIFDIPKKVKTFVLNLNLGKKWKIYFCQIMRAHAIGGNFISEYNQKMRKGEFSKLIKVECEKQDSEASKRRKNNV